MKRLAAIVRPSAFGAIAAAAIMLPLITVASPGNGENATGNDPEIINVKATKGDATPLLRKAIERAASRKGKPTEIRLEAGATYSICRKSATEALYHISNTTSAEENADPTKHIGLLFKGIENVTLNGNGATLVTHGEITPWAIDSCSHVCIRNLTIKAADPTVAEMTVTAIDLAEGMPEDSTWITVEVNPLSRYEIRDGKLWWTGEGWEFTDGIAQLYDPATVTTFRCNSPLSSRTEAVEVAPGRLRLKPGFRSEARPGMVYQMRHSYRYEVGGFINRSRDVALESLTLNSVANFGIVGQFSENLTYREIACVPDTLSGRTCSGYADFFHFSGCRGKLTVTDCRFRGSHDDDINVHGTHLMLVGTEDGGRKLRVRFMHGQTFGFAAFTAGDRIAFNNRSTLLTLGEARVEDARMAGDYEMVLTLAEPLNASVAGEIGGKDGVVVENLTWYPDVEIRGCLFECMPTRGILMTTPGHVVIEENLFRRVPMASVLIADDARSWYESGAVRDITVRRNRFVECSGPVILVAPENSRYEGPVHRGIRIEDNSFENCTGLQLKAGATEGIRFTGNRVTAGICSGDTSGERNTLCNRDAGLSIELLHCPGAVVK